MKLRELIAISEAEIIDVFARRKGERSTDRLCGELGDWEFREKLEKIGDFEVTSVSPGYDRGTLEISAEEK